MGFMGWPLDGPFERNAPFIMAAELIHDSLEQAIIVGLKVDEAMALRLLQIRNVSLALMPGNKHQLIQYYAENYIVKNAEKTVFLKKISELKKELQFIKNSPDQNRYERKQWQSILDDVTEIENELNEADPIVQS